MNVSVNLRYENHDESEAWFSNTPDVEAENVAFYIPTNLWFAMGNPKALTVTVTGTKEDS